MTIAMKPLAELDPNSILDNTIEIAQRLQEDNAYTDAGRGAFYDLLSYPSGMLAARLEANLADYLSARSLNALLNDPTADPSLVDDVLSNYMVTRKVGNTASGSITIVLAKNTSVTIGRGALFTSQGKTYVSTNVFTAKAEAAQVIGPNDRLITATPDGKYSFNIDVQAAAAGASYNLGKGSLIVPNVPPPNYVTSYATSDFVPGTDTETNQELLQRLQYGIAAKTLSSRPNMIAMLKTVSGLQNIVNMSIVGAGDPQMIRDKRSIFPLGISGGRADWYIRPEAKVRIGTVTKTATRIDSEFEHQPVYQVTFTKSEFPGFYEVRAIRLTGATLTDGSYPVTGDIRSVDLSGTDKLPDIVNPVEGVYSAYQTVTIQFADLSATGSVSVGATKNFDFDIVYVPLIDTAQTTVASRGVSHFGADCLVKAAIPCFVTVAINISQPTGAAVLDTNYIAASIAAEINKTAFTGRLFAGRLVDIVHGFLTDSLSSVAQVVMTGRIRRPDGTLLYLSDTSALVVPEEGITMVGARTVQFYSDPDSVAINIVTEIPNP